MYNLVLRMRQMFLRMNCTCNYHRTYTCNCNCVPASCVFAVILK